VLVGRRRMIDSEKSSLASVAEGGDGTWTMDQKTNCEED